MKSAESMPRQVSLHGEIMEDSLFPTPGSRTHHKDTPARVDASAEGRAVEITVRIKKQ